MDPTEEQYLARIDRVYKRTSQSISELLNHIAIFFKTDDIDRRGRDLIDTWCSGTISMDVDPHVPEGVARNKYAATEIEDARIEEFMRDLDEECWQNGDLDIDSMFEHADASIEHWWDEDEDEHRWFTVRKLIK